MNTNSIGKIHFKHSLTLLAALFLPLLGGSAPVPPPEKLLPDDTLVVITAPDFAKLRAVCQQSPSTQLWNDPAMKPFKDKFMARLQEKFITPLEHDLNVRFSDYTNLVQGQFTFAVTQNGWQGKDQPAPGVLLLADAKDKSDQLKKNLADLKKKWVDAGKPMKTEKIRDVEFSILVITSNDMPKTLKNIFAPEPRFQNSKGKTEEPSPTSPETKKDTPKNNLYVGQSGSLLIVGNAAKPIERVLINLAGALSPTLGEQAAYRANHATMFRAAPLFGWVNVKAFVDVILSAAKADSESDKDGAAANPFSPKPDKVISATGLNALKTISFSLRDSGEGSLFHLFFDVPEANRTGIFKILAGQAKESMPPAFVPTEAVKFSRWRLDGQKAWATLEKTLNDISPQMFGALNFMLESAGAAAKQKDPDFDLKKNLVGSLGDDIINYQKAPRTTSLNDLKSPPALVLVGSPKPEQLVNALKTLLGPMSQAAGGLTEREFLGRKIYSVQLPMMQAMAAGKPQPRSLSFAASAGYVGFSMDAATLEEFLRSESKGKALRETPGLTEASQKVAGPGTSLFGYENQAEQMRALFEVLKKDSGSATNLLSELSPLSGAVGLGELKDWIDVSLLPPYEKVAKYFYFTVSALSASVDGISLKVFAPTPPQLKK